MGTEKRNTTDHEANRSPTRTETLGLVSSEGQGEHHPVRRSFLKGALATVAAAVGFSSTTAALNPFEQRKLRQARREFDSEAATREALQTHGEDVLKLLATRGYIDSTDVDQFAQDAIDISAIHMGGEATAYIHTSKEIDEGNLGINIAPQAERQYAIITPSGRKTGQSTILDPSLEDGVEPQCVAFIDCVGGGCMCEEYYVCYRDGTCRLNGRVGQVCTTTCADCATCP